MWHRPDFLNSVSNRFHLSDRFARENDLRLIPNVMPGYGRIPHLRGFNAEAERAETKFFGTIGAWRAIS